MNQWLARADLPGSGVELGHFGAADASKGSRMVAQAKRTGQARESASQS